MKARRPLAIYLLFSDSSDDEGLYILEQIVARIVIHFHGDRLAQVEAEYAKYRLGIHDVTARAQIDVVRILIDDVDKGLVILRQAQLVIDGLDGYNILKLRSSDIESPQRASAPCADPWFYDIAYEPGMQVHLR